MKTSAFLPSGWRSDISTKEASESLWACGHSPNNWYTARGVQKTALNALLIARPLTFLLYEPDLRLEVLHRPSL